jgi:hypothetical protein
MEIESAYRIVHLVEIQTIRVDFPIGHQEKS